MKPPIFVRVPSEEERESLEAGLRSRETFVMRRCQILLASARGLSPPKIAHSLGCASQTARNAIHAFNERGTDALARTLLAPPARPCRLRRGVGRAAPGLLHRSPREFGYESSLWTLQMAADAAFEAGITDGRVFRGDHPGDALAPSGHTLDAGQEVDHLPRPPVRKNKG